jgi:hypothetical protein
MVVRLVAHMHSNLELSRWAPCLKLGLAFKFKFKIQPDFITPIYKYTYCHSNW